MKDEYRIMSALQTFTIILTIKSISAGYYAAKYSMENNLELVSHYAQIMNQIAISLFIVLILFIIPLFVNLKNKTKKFYDWTALTILAIALLTLFL